MTEDAELSTVAVLEALVRQRGETGGRVPAAAKERRLEDLVAPGRRYGNGRTEEGNAEDRQEAARVRAELAQHLNRAVRERLGPQFSVSRLELYGGSLELLAVVGMVGTAVQGYGAVRQGLDLLRQDFQRVITRILQRHGFEDVETPEVKWSPGHLLMHEEPGEGPPSRAARLLGDRDPMLAYFLMVHLLVLAVILGVVVVLLVDSV